jgi:hypothetical protein
MDESSSGGHGGSAGENVSSPWFRPATTHTQEHDLVLMMVAGQKRYLITLRKGQHLHTHLGIFAHDALIGQPWGTVVLSTLEQPGLVLEPALGDLMTHIKRGTQIVYPKDAAYLVQRLNLRAGSQVVEAGTGSGVLTTALAWAVAPSGKVYTYELRPDTYQLARRNLERVGLLPYVECPWVPSMMVFANGGSMRSSWMYVLRGNFYLLPARPSNQAAFLLLCCPRQTR